MKCAFSAIALMCLFVSGLLAQTPLATLANSMQPGTWAKLTTTNINAVLGQGQSAGNRIPYAMAGAWDSVRQTLQFYGRDHVDTCMGTHASYSAATNTWSAVGCANYNTGHAYDHNVVDPITGTLYQRGYKLGFIPWEIWKYPVGGPWTIATTYNSGYQQVAVGTAWWSGTMTGGGVGGMYLLYNCGAPNGQVSLWNPATNTWLPDILGFGGVSTYHCFAEYSPIHNVAVFGGGNDNPRKLWRMNPDRTITALADAPINVGVQRGNVSVDSVTGHFLVMGYGKLWEFNPTGSGTWVEQTGAVPPASDVGNPAVANVISASISNLGVVMYVTCFSANCDHVMLYKHSGAPPPPPPPPDVTPPTAPTAPTIQPPSTVTLNWVASTDNIGVTGYLIERCQGPGCANFMQIATTGGTSFQDTGLQPLTNYSYRIRATDAAGNLSPYSAIISLITDFAGLNPQPTTSPPVASDFTTRCAAPGVVKCVAFDSQAEITGSWGNNPQGVVSKGNGILPVIDTAVKASGTGSMRMTVPAGSPGGVVGDFFANFSNDYSVQFGENTEFFVQYRFRPDDNYITSTRSVGMKQDIVGTGSTASVPFSSCTDLEFVTQNNLAAGVWGWYQNCGRYEGFQEGPYPSPYNSIDYLLQNAQGRNPGCWHYAPNFASRVPPVGSCVPYVANEWMTIQKHVKLGPLAQINTQWWFTNSYLDVWVAREGQPSIQVLKVGPYNIGPMFPNTQKYGQVWLLAYSGGGIYPVASTVRYDDLIISRNKIADPGGAVAPPPLPPPPPPPPPPTGDVTPPTITFVTPNGASFSSNDISLRVRPLDANAVVCVEMFRAGYTEHIVKNCESDLRKSPLYLRWQAVGIPLGTYNLTAYAYDAAGNKSLPATVTVIRK